jgi:hypothetical protein
MTMSRSATGITAVFSVVLLGIVSSAIADDSCSAVYQNATRDIDSETKINQQLDYVFDNYCNKDGSKQTFNMSDQVGIIFDDLPINFKANKGATNERVTEFCRNYSSQRYVNNRYFHYKNDVQVAALVVFRPHGCEPGLPKPVFAVKQRTDIVEKASTKKLISPNFQRRRYAGDAGRDRRYETAAWKLLCGFEANREQQRVLRSRMESSGQVWRIIRARGRGCVASGAEGKATGGSLGSNAHARPVSAS